MREYTVEQKGRWAQTREWLKEYAGQPIDPTDLAETFRQIQKADGTHSPEALNAMDIFLNWVLEDLREHMHTPAPEPGCKCQSCGCGDGQSDREPYEWTPEDEDLFTLVSSLLDPLAVRYAPKPDPLIYGDPILEEFVLDSQITWIYGHLRQNGEPTLAVRYWHYAKGLPYFPEDWEPLESSATAEDLPL